MKHQTTAFFGALLAVAGFQAQAQEEFPVLPVEMFGCTWQSGQNMSDLDSANDTFNEWADGAGITDLTSLVLTPHYFSSEQQYEVIGMDIWNTGAALGSGVGQIMANPDAVADYDEVVACDAHAIYALVGVKPPAEGQSIDGGMFEFTDCTIRANHSPEDGIATVATIGGLWTPWNVGDAHGVMFPVSGETPDADYTFKWITFYPSMEAYGAVFDHYVEGFVVQAGAIISPVMQCNNSRMYDLSIVREAQDQ
jgi:hypothetical protein